MSERFKQMFANMTPDEKLEALMSNKNMVGGQDVTAGAVIPTDGGEKVVQRLGEFFRVAGTGDEGRITGRDLVGAAVGRDTLPESALEALGSGAETLLDPSNLFTAGGAGLVKAGMKEAAKKAAATGVAQTLPDFKTRTRPGTPARKVETTVSGQPEPMGRPLGREPMSPQMQEKIKANKALFEKQKADMAEVRKRDQRRQIQKLNEQDELMKAQELERQLREQASKTGRFGNILK